MGEFSDNYYSWLDRQMSGTSIGIESFTGTLKKYLSERLAEGEVAVQDSMPKIREDIFGKRSVGRPKKEEDEVKTRGGFAEGVLKEERKEKARKLDRLNPQPTEKLKHLQELSVGLREIGFDAEDALIGVEEIETMILDIDSLRKEAGLKKIDETFEPYFRFRSATKEYIDRKNDFKKYYDAAKESLSKQEERKSEELIETLKDEPKAIKEAYKSVVDAYSGLCDSLTSIIDMKEGKESEYKKNDVSSVAGAGIGLIEGEDYKSYSKRLKALGRYKDIPKTIRDIEDRIARTERQWRSVSGLSIDEFNRVKENWRRSVRGLMEKSSLASNMKITEVNELLGWGEPEKTSRDTGEGIIAVSGDKKERYIRYGCLHALTPNTKDTDIGDAYGGIVVRWKPNCVVATMTFGDSLDIESSDTTFETPCLVTDASPCCFNPLKQDAIIALKEGVIDIGLDTARTIFGIPYIELQFHGEGWYKPQSIESISFWSEDDIRNLSQQAIDQIVKNGIGVYVKDEKVKIAEVEGTIWN